MNYISCRLYDIDDDILDEIRYTIEENPISENVRLLITGVCDDLVVYEFSNIILYNGYYFKLTKEEICDLLDLAKGKLEEDLDYVKYTSYNDYLVELSAAYERRQFIDLNKYY